MLECVTGSLVAGAKRKHYKHIGFYDNCGLCSAVFFLVGGGDCADSLELLLKYPQLLWGQHRENHNTEASAKFSCQKIVPERRDCLGVMPKGATTERTQHYGIMTSCFCHLKY